VSELLTLEQVGERLGGVSRRTVEREIAAGRLRAVHVRRRVFVAARELEAYLAAAHRAA
jgi:excisionase family DNA binding protein